MARRRRSAARRNPKRGRRVVRRNPKRGRRVRTNGRRLRRNSGEIDPLMQIAAAQSGTIAVAGKKARKKYTKEEKKVLALARRKRLRRSANLYRTAGSRLKRARKMPKRSLRRQIATVQAGRWRAASRVLKGRGSLAKSAVYKAMHLKANPGMAGLVVAAKVLVPQAAVGAVAMVGLAMGGAQLGNRIAGITQLPAVVRTYARPIGTTLLTGGAYVLADKFAPKFKGAVAIGGLLAVVLQTLAVAKGTVSVGPTATKALAALGLGDYTTVGRAYAEGGMFRNIGEGPETRDGGAYSIHRPRASLDNATQYALNGPGMETRQGGAYSIHRPRPSADNATEFALNGADDNTEFADGEGGLLNGGMFRGSSR